VPQGLVVIFTTDLREAERFLSAPGAATAASPTSTSAPRAPRSAAPSAARRTPAAGASPAPTPGRPTCAARPTPSTLGTSVLLGLARARGIRSFVFASSSSVYGETKEGSFHEDAVADRPISPYAATKRAGELLCHADAHLHGLNCLALRFFTVYGPRQRPDLAIRSFARRLLEGEEIPRFGDGTSERDYTFVSDTVDGILAALQRSRNGESRYEVFNLGRGEPVTLNHLIEELAGALGVEARIRELPAQPGDVSRTLASIEEAGSVLGYSPSVSLEDGIRQFAEWYLEVGAREEG
jgi:UDP-glucuronate 4-epimerase